MTELAQVKTERMRELASFLDTVPPEDFTLSAWCSRAARPARVERSWFLWRSTRYIDALTFRGCALAHAANAELFPGLRIEKGCLRYGYGPKPQSVQIGFDAGAALLGINDRATKFLFCGSTYGEVTVRPQHVTNRLRTSWIGAVRELTDRKPGRIGRRMMSWSWPTLEERRCYAAPRCLQPRDRRSVGRHAWLGPSRI